MFTLPQGTDYIILFDSKPVFSIGQLGQRSKQKTLRKMNEAENG